MSIDFQALRYEYTKQGLSRKDLDNDPIKQFEKWFNDAKNSGILAPEAMSLASSDGKNVSVRTVLLKSFDKNGFVFFTNYDSKKAEQISKNPNVEALFPWIDLERQVRISGLVNKISSTESENYFHSRPRDAQIGAWTSNQSKIIASREDLERAFRENTEKFEGKEIPLPEFWGGYRIQPGNIEFWQGRLNRLHDRFIYSNNGKDWDIKRYAP
jgi:pyridoxamine 5'-phosphate oxidase